MIMGFIKLHPAYTVSLRALGTRAVFLLYHTLSALWLLHIYIDINIQYLSAPCAGCTLGPKCPMQHCQNVTELWAGM